MLVFVFEPLDLFGSRLVELLEWMPTPEVYTA